MLLSLVTSGFWIPTWLDRLGSGDQWVLLSRNLSLWPQVGGWVLLIWPLILALPLSRERRLIAVLAGTALTSPYFPLPSAVLLLALAVPWWTWGIAQLPALSFLVGGWIYSVGKILPIGLLLWATWPELRAWGERRWGKDRRVQDVQ
jgi:hypothetical protein